MGSFGPIKWGRDAEISAIRKEFKEIRKMLYDEYQDETLDEVWAMADSMKSALYRVMNPQQQVGQALPPEMLTWIVNQWQALPDSIKTAVNLFARMRYRATVEQILGNPAVMNKVLPQIFNEMPWLFRQGPAKPTGPQMPQQFGQIPYQQGPPRQDRPPYYEGPGR